MMSKEKWQIRGTKERIKMWSKVTLWIKNSSRHSFTRVLVNTLFQFFIFCPKIQLWFPEKIVDFLGWKTRENVVVLHFLAVDNFDFTRKIVKKNSGEKLVKMLGFCPNWIFGQKFDFSNSVVPTILLKRLTSHFFWLSRSSKKFICGKMTIRMGLKKARMDNAAAVQAPMYLWQMNRQPS